MRLRRGHSGAGMTGRVGGLWELAEAGVIIPSVIDPEQAGQTRPRGSRSFVRQALHLDPRGLFP